MRRLFLVQLVLCQLIIFHNLQSVKSQPRQGAVNRQPNPSQHQQNRGPPPVNPNFNNKGPPTSNNKPPQSQPQAPNLQGQQVQSNTHKKPQSPNIHKGPPQSQQNSSQDHHRRVENIHISLKASPPKGPPAPNPQDSQRRVPQAQNPPPVQQKAPQAPIQKNQQKPPAASHLQNAPHQQKSHPVPPKDPLVFQSVQKPFAENPQVPAPVAHSHKAPSAQQKAYSSKDSQGPRNNQPQVLNPNKEFPSLSHSHKNKGSPHQNDRQQKTVLAPNPPKKSEPPNSQNSFPLDFPKPPIGSLNTGNKKSNQISHQNVPAPNPQKTSHSHRSPKPFNTDSKSPGRNSEGGNKLIRPIIIPTPPQKSDLSRFHIKNKIEHFESAANIPFESSENAHRDKQDEFERSNSNGKEQSNSNVERAFKDGQLTRQGVSDNGRRSDENTDGNHVIEHKSWISEVSKLQTSGIAEEHSGGDKKKVSHHTKLDLRLEPSSKDFTKSSSQTFPKSDSYILSSKADSSDSGSISKVTKGTTTTSKTSSDSSKANSHSITQSKPSNSKTTKTSGKSQSNSESEISQRNTVINDDKLHGETRFLPQKRRKQDKLPIHLTSRPMQSSNTEANSLKGDYTKKTNKNQAKPLGTDQSSPPRESTRTNSKEKSPSDSSAISNSNTERTYKASSSKTQRTRIGNSDNRFNSPEPSTESSKGYSQTKNRAPNTHSPTNSGTNSHSPTNSGSNTHSPSSSGNNKLPSTDTSSSNKLQSPTTNLLSATKPTMLQSNSRDNSNFKSDIEFTSNSDSSMSSSTTDLKRFLESGKSRSNFNYHIHSPTNSGPPTDYSSSAGNKMRDDSIRQESAAEVNVLTSGQTANELPQFDTNTNFNQPEFPVDKVDDASSISHKVSSIKQNQYSRSNLIQTSKTQMDKTLLERKISNIPNPSRQIQQKFPELNTEPPPPEVKSKKTEYKFVSQNKEWQSFVKNLYKGTPFEITDSPLLATPMQEEIWEPESPQLEELEEQMPVESELSTKYWDNVPEPPNDDLLAAAFDNFEQGFHEQDLNEEEMEPNSQTGSETEESERFEEKRDYDFEDNEVDSNSADSAEENEYYEELKSYVRENDKDHFDNDFSEKKEGAGATKKWWQFWHKIPFLNSSGGKPSLDLSKFLFILYHCYWIISQFVFK